MAKRTSTKVKRTTRRPTPPQHSGPPYTLKGLVKKAKGTPQYGHQLHQLVVYARANWSINPSEFRWANDEIHRHIRFAARDHTAVGDVGLSGDLDDEDTTGGRRCTNNTTFMHLDFLKYI